LIALDLARHEAKAVAIHYHSAESKKDAEKIIAALAKFGAGTLMLPGDLSKPEAM